MILMRKVLFLDIDGVVNCRTTKQRHRGFIGIDPYMAFLVGKIVMYTECEVVLSSSWRVFFDDGVKEISDQVTQISDVTPPPWYDREKDHHSTRGEEIQAWLDKNPDVTHYAILDDDTRMLPSQLTNYFQTSWETGITESIAEAVKRHLSTGTTTTTNSNSCAIIHSDNASTRHNNK